MYHELQACNNDCYVTGSNYLLNGLPQRVSREGTPLPRRVHNDIDKLYIYIAPPLQYFIDASAFARRL